MTHELIRYPAKWEDEYRKTGNVQVWLDQHSGLFPRYILEERGYLRANRNQLYGFAQYALQVRLMQLHGIESRTWLRVAMNPPRGKRQEYVRECHAMMRGLMGQPLYDALQRSLEKHNLRGFKGEPDLFCWKGDDWFFAEAKRGDPILESQIKWFKVLRALLPEPQRLRLYVLRPEA